MRLIDSSSEYTMKTSLLIRAGALLALALPCTALAQTLDIVVRPDDFTEGSVDYVRLRTKQPIVPDTWSWDQVSGPRVPLTGVSAQLAYADVRDLEVAVDTELVFELTVTTAGQTETAAGRVSVRPVEATPMMGPHVQLGGATTVASIYDDGAKEWALFNAANRLSATEVAPSAEPVHSIHVSGFIHDLVHVDYQGAHYALLATGRDGIAIVDVTDPTAMACQGSVTVNYYRDGITFTEGGGAILVDQVKEGTRGTVQALETDGHTLWIGNGDYGLHRTSLDNLLAAGGPVLEPDGTLLVEHERFTLLYAGEIPWGGPRGMLLFENRLFVAVDSLGLAIVDPVTLERVGRYNLYTDAGLLEDWFLDMDVAQEVQPGFLDPEHGMPDYNQVSYEILNSKGSGGGNQIATPWADFERYGKYYYNSQKVDVARYGDVTYAFVAYGLGGLVAVDVTGFETATPFGSKDFLEAEYVAYAPGVPAHGPDEFIGSHNDNIFPHFGAGMLKEAGAIDVTATPTEVYYTDHFAGLVVLEGADDPAATWRGQNAPYDNDDGVWGNHEPDYEFVTSYDMSPWDPLDHESLPTWMYEAPSLLVTGEIGGHGNRLHMVAGFDATQAGGVDALVCLGAGGLDFVDLTGFSAPDMADRFEVLAYFPTTDEIGAAPDGSPTQTIAIGHTQGVDASDRYLYVADGPHGISAWPLVDLQGFPTDDLQLVGNTVQDEYPVDVGGTLVYPATHAYGIVFDPASQSAMTLCQGVGMRRVPVADVELGAGQIGAPLLLAPQPEDIFEHNGAWGKIKSVPKQDHAYDVAIRGDLAFVADGGNGLTIYDLTKDPTDIDSGFFVSNLGGATKARPLLGRSTGIALWTSRMGRDYALLAAGPYGVGVADVTDPFQPTLVKTFEPIKLEDGKVGKADGRCVDVFVFGEHAYFTYDGFGVVCYALKDLVRPVPPGIDPTKIWKSQNGNLLYDYRPIAVGEFRLREDPVYADWGGGALNMAHTAVDYELVLYVGYAEAGVVVIGWSEPDSPELLDVWPTVGECQAIAISNGRLYAADGGGGLVFFK